MFHRAPSFSFVAVIAAALIFLLVTLFASPLSSPGAVHADHPGSLPEVSITSITPEVGEEDSRLRVTLKLSRPLTADEQYCYGNEPTSEGSTGEVCIQGGIIVWDTYDDHLYEEGGSKYDNGRVPSNRLVKFVFRNNKVEERLSVTIADDECITPDREIRIAINTSFDNTDDYGYTIDTSEYTRRISGDDETNGQYIDSDDHSKGECGEVEEGTTEEFISNHAPLFDDIPPTFEVAENTAANQPVGDPVSATDPDNVENPNTDELTYSLQGQDAASFNIDSSTGQIKTKAALDFETKSTYHVAVFVRDSKDYRGDPDAVDDNSIDVTINVTDVNEAPEFDSNAPTTLNVVENTVAGENIGEAITATDPDENDTISYSLDDGDGAAYDIDTSTGQIKTKDPLDRETKSFYSVTVTASDGDLDATHSVTITVTDDTTEPPTFDEEYPQGQSSLTREVAENTAAGQPVGAPVSAKDDDGDTLTYSLDDQEGANFEIDSSGQIKTKSDLDYETTPSYSVTVSVTDSKDDAGNTESNPTEDATVDVTINVTDINEGPVFSDTAPTTLSIDENTATDTDITDGLFTATDPESDTLTYSLGGTDAASFCHRCQRPAQDQGRLGSRDQGQLLRHHPGH